MKERWKRSISLWEGLCVGVCLLLVGPWAWSDKAPDYVSGQVGRAVAKLLEQAHFRGQPLTDEVSRQFFTNYLSTLDYNRIFFRESDIELFKKYEETLDDNLLVANLTPAFEIFECYSNRVEQTVQTVKEWLNEPFRFDGDGYFVTDRRDAAWAANDEEARELLRSRVKFELLEERLSRTDTAEITQTVARRYDRMLRGLHETDADSILDLYLNSLAQVYDPHTWAT